MTVPLSLTVKKLRQACAKKLLELEGIVPGALGQQFEKQVDGTIVGSFRLLRGEAEKKITLQAYCELLETSLFGGDLEIDLMCHMFAIQVSVYSAGFWDGAHGIAQPEIHGSANPSASDIHACILHEETSSGGTDHYWFIQSKFSMHALIMSRMPVWGKDIVIVDCGSMGRGLMVKKRILKDDPIGWYDGHHVDEQGNIVFERAVIAELMRQFPVIDRVRQGTPFQTTHAVRLGRSHSTGLMIDGGPLSHPAIDHVVGLGRMVLANSANPKQANMCVFSLMFVTPLLFITRTRSGAWLLSRHQICQIVHTEEAT